MPATGEEQLSSVKTAHLKDLASRTGLSYAELQNTGSIASQLLAASEPRVVPTRTDMSWMPALLALLSLLALYALQLFERAPMRRGPRVSSTL